MSRIFKSVLCFVFMFCLFIQPSSASGKTGAIKVTLVRIELVENNHVGNDWYTTAHVNGKVIAEGSTVSLNLKSNSSIKLKAYAEEQDKIPDIGTANASIKLSTIKKTTNKELNVRVVENRGRYSGNTALWKFTFKIQK
ncbi:hypothetical protein [Paenibacillus sp. DMB20]|uniref:hypothetical protein n=1 Tax=Paenibacillus sp. DMB20 TaxID=1642570 RepID=UPI000B006861|nr:hypothetical protein [Paenibacillus sp. DMB20]